MRPFRVKIMLASLVRPRAAALLLGRNPAMRPALASPLRTRGYHGHSHMSYEPWMGQQAHATTILSVRKDDKVVRAQADTQRDICTV